MNVAHAQALLQEFRTRGIHVATDDFGTGYSSLSHLKYFYIDKLKIDQSFVRDVVGDRRDAAVVGATIAMAKLLNASVTAEGVETAEQLAFLRKRRCTIAQGHFLTEPVDATAMGELLAADLENKLPPADPAANMPEFEFDEPAANALN